MFDPRDAASTSPTEVDEEAPDGALLCSSCGNLVTRESDRTEVDGAHESVRVNLAGMVFRVGCFIRAPGCRPVGETSGNWTWFAGHTWQVVICARCGEHLGWLYRGPSRFYGLLLDQLTRK